MAKKLIFNDDMVFKKDPDIQTIKTDEGIIISSANPKDDSIYYLDNPVSFKIWELINGRNSLKVIKQDLLFEYEVTENKLEQELKKFIKDLYLKKLITNAKNVKRAHSRTNL